MPRRSPILIIAVTALLAAAVAVATAATPSSGKVSKDSPSVSWEGTLANSAITFNAFNQDTSTPCAPPTCDTFALEVADGPANLELTINLQRKGQDGSSADGGFRITKPDGGVEWVSGPSDPDKAFKYVLKGAKNGAYTVDVVDSFIGTPGTYVAKATLLIAGATATAPAPSAPPASNPQPGAPQQAQPLPTLTAKAGKASARKLARAKKLAVKLTSTAPLTKLAATLRRGKATVGKGKLARLESKGTLTLKLPRKVKKGSYKLTVQGLDSQGRTVTATAPVKIAR